MANYKISVDGSFVDKHRIYGAVVVQNQETKQINSYLVKCETEQFADSRNVYGEVAAASLAVLIIESLLEEDKDTKVTLIFDYMGIKNWATGEWSANKMISKCYAALWQAKKHILPCVSFVHQKGHSGISSENAYLNDLADRVAGLKVKPTFVTKAIL